MMPFDARVIAILATLCLGCSSDAVPADPADAADVAQDLGPPAPESCRAICPHMASAPCPAPPTTQECVVKCEPLIEYGPCPTEGAAWLTCIAAAPEFGCLMQDGTVDPAGIQCKPEFDALGECLAEF